MLVKKTYKNQITIPKKAIQKIKDSDYFNLIIKDGKIILIPVEIVEQDITLSNIRKKIKSLGITEKDIEKAIQWARRKKG